MLKLVYVCLGFSAVALAALLIASSTDDATFRGTTDVMMRDLQNPATVLDADLRGAVTQTANGTVAGYLRGEDSPAWSIDFKRYAGAGPGHLEPRDAVAKCAGTCPAAITAFEGRYRARGGASSALAAQLNAYGANLELLELLAGGRALAAQPVGAAAKLKLLSGARVEVLPATAPSVAKASSTGYRVIAGAGRAGTGVLTRSIRSGGRWVAGAPDLEEPGLQNICISADGRWVGAVSHRLLLMPFIGDAQNVAGNPVTGGICRADSAGFTFAVNPARAPGHVAAVRFTHDGRRLWARTFGSQHLLSPSGSPLIVVSDRQWNISVVDSISGKALLHSSLPQEPFVGDDGAIVIADRAGRPNWVKVPR